MYVCIALHFKRNLLEYFIKTCDGDDQKVRCNGQLKILEIQWYKALYRKLEFEPLTKLKHICHTCWDIHFNNIKLFVTSYLIMMPLFMIAKWKQYHQAEISRHLSFKEVSPLTQYVPIITRNGEFAANSVHHQVDWNSLLDEVQFCPSPFLNYTFQKFNIEFQLLTHSVYTKTNLFPPEGYFDFHGHYH